MTDSKTVDNDWQRLAGNTQVLIRSQSEILKFLNEIKQNQSPLLANFSQNENLFVSRLRHITQDCKYILIEYSENRTANKHFLSSQNITLSAAHRRGRIDFIVTHRADVVYENDRLIRCDYPDILMIYQRRAHHRIPVIPKVPLHCMADTRGFLTFECKITDIGRGGLGAMICDESVVLEPGTILKGCKITHPNGMVIEVDIEVRHCVKTVLDDGTFAQRVGCSFVGIPAQLEELIKVFLLNLAKE